MTRYLTRMRLVSLIVTVVVAVAVATVASRLVTPRPPPAPASPATIRANEDSPELERAGAQPDFDKPTRNR